MAKSITIRMRILYAAVTLITSYIVSPFSIYTVRLLFNIITKVVPLTQERIDNIGIPIIGLLNFAVSLAVLALFMRVFISRNFSDIYEPEQNPLQWIIKTLELIIPGELLRFVIYMFSGGVMTSENSVALEVLILYERIYLTPFNRLNALYLFGDFVFADYVANAVCYLIYFALLLACFLPICKRIWNKSVEEYDDLVRPVQENFTNHRRPY